MRGGLHRRMTENDAMASFSVILGRGPNGTQESQSFSHFNENELYNKKQVSKKIETGAHPKLRWVYEEIYG